MGCNLTSDLSGWFEVLGLACILREAFFSTLPLTTCSLQRAARVLSDVSMCHSELFCCVSVWVPFNGYYCSWSFSKQISFKTISVSFLFSELVVLHPLLFCCFYLVLKMIFISYSIGY